MAQQNHFKEIHAFFSFHLYMTSLPIPEKPMSWKNAADEKGKERMGVGIKEKEAASLQLVTPDT